MPPRQIIIKASAQMTKVAIDTKTFWFLSVWHNFNQARI